MDHSFGYVVAASTNCAELRGIAGAVYQLRSGLQAAITAAMGEEVER